MNLLAPQYNRDGGQIIPLVIVYAALALSLVIAVVDITAVHIQRDRLFAVADAAALNAANALDSPQFYRQGGLVQVGDHRPLPLSDLTVVRSVQAYLSDPHAAQPLSGLGVGRPTGAPDPGTAEVTLVARGRLPLFGTVLGTWWDGVPLRVTVTAQARERR